MDSTEQIQNMLVSTVAANVDGIMLHKLESTFMSDWNQDLKDHFDKLGVSNITELVLSMKNRLQLLGSLVYQVNDGNIQDVVDLITESKTINIEERNQKNAMKARQREKERGRSTYKNSTSVNVNQRAKSFFSSSNAIVKPVKSIGKINGNMVPLPPGKFFNSTYCPAPSSSNIAVLDLFTSGLKRCDTVNTTGASIATLHGCSTAPSTSKTYDYGNPHIPFFTSITPPNPPSPARGFGVSNTVEDELDGGIAPPEKPNFLNAQCNSDMFFNPGHRKELKAKFGISPNQVNSAKTDPQEQEPEESPFGKYPVAPSGVEFGIPPNRKPVNGTGNYKFISSKFSKVESNRKKNTAFIPDGYKKSIAGFIQSNSRNMRMPPTLMISRPARFTASMSATEPARKILDPDWDGVLKCVNIIKERGKVRTKNLEKLVEEEFGRSLDKAFMREVFGVEIPYLNNALLMMKDTVFRYISLADCFELKYPYEEIVEKFGVKKKPQELEATSKGAEKEETTVSEALTFNDKEEHPSSLETVIVKDGLSIPEKDCSTTKEEKTALSIQEVPDVIEPSSSTNILEILNDGFDITERTNEKIFSHSTLQHSRRSNVEVAPNSVGTYRQKQVSESESDHSEGVLDIINQIVLPDEAKDFDSMTNTITEIDGTAFYVNKTIRTLLMVIMQFDDNEEITMRKIGEALLYESRGQMELTVELMNEAFGLKASTVEEAFKTLPQFFTYIDGKIELDSFLPFFLEEGYTLVFDKFNRIHDVEATQMLKINPSCIQNSASMKE